jgi:hypothetical protein
MHKAIVTNVPATIFFWIRYPAIAAAIKGISE